jgi:hypothetical protein
MIESILRLVRSAGLEGHLYSGFRVVEEDVLVYINQSVEINLTAMV